MGKISDIFDSISHLKVNKIKNKHLRTNRRGLILIYPAELIYLNFHPLEVVSRYRDPQLQVSENYSYLFNFSTSICKSSCLDTRFIPNNSDLVD